MSDPGIACKVDGCTKPRRNSRHCAMHEWRTREFGEPGPVGYLRRRKGCTEQGCHGRHHARGLCRRHYCQWLRETKGPGPREPKPRPHRQARVCTFEGCGEPYAARGMCARHYNVAWKYVNHAGSDWARARELAAKVPTREGVA